MRCVSGLLVLVATLVSTGVAAGATPAPFQTVAQTEAQILDSLFAKRSAMRDVTCIGVVAPKPKTNPAGLRTYHRFLCRASFDSTGQLANQTGQIADDAGFRIRVIVQLTKIGFNVLPVRVVTCATRGEDYLSGCARVVVKTR
jgi:hypothetical protein